MSISFAVRFHWHYNYKGQINTRRRHLLFDWLLKQISFVLLMFGDNLDVFDVFVYMYKCGKVKRSRFSLF